MGPRDTTYRLARTPDDYRRASALVAEYMDRQPLHFPTVLAERRGELVGVLSTDTRQGAIIATPLVVRGRSIFVAIRLVEAYDVVMRKAGVSAYHFRVDRENAGWRAQIERFGMQPWHDDAEGVWFRRNLHAA